MEILALYNDTEALETALAAGARHLAATLDGCALIYRGVSAQEVADGWAGFTCAKDAEAAGEALHEFRCQIEQARRPLRSDAPEEPARIWARASGGLFGFPLQHAGTLRGVAIVGSPGEWPRMRNAEIESILRQITLVLDHHAVSSEKQSASNEPSDEMLRLSEHLLTQDFESIKRHEAEAQLETVKSDLVEKMSHELRTPLNNIIERVIAVLAGEHESLSNVGREALKEALDDGNSLLRMLQNVLDLWRIKQDQLRVEFQAVNITEVVEEAIFNVRDKLQPDVIFEKRLSSPLPKVRTDLTKLNQILFHLLDNAAKFTRRGRIELEVDLEDDRLRCSVSDTGIGISQDDQTSIFDEFFQVDHTPKKRHQGAGLGLTLARALVEQLGGKIEVSAEIGRGSRFTVTLPVSEL